MSQMDEAARERERDADVARRIEDLRVSLIRAINTALSRAGLAAWPDDLRVAAIAEAEDEAKRAVAAERERDEARAKLAAETARADQNYRDLQAARAAVHALEDWRADVTVAMRMGRRRPGDVQFADVPRHIRDLVRERDEYRRLWDGLDVEREKWAALARENEDLRRRAETAEQALAEATTWRPMGEHIAAPTIVAWRGKGGRACVYSACNFGPLQVHEQTDALGWLPIPPYRAKEEQ